MNQKGSARVVLIVVIMILTAVGGYLAWFKKTRNVFNVEPIVNTDISNFKFADPALSQSICEIIDNSTFASIGKYDVGMGPDGPVKDSYEIIFKDGKFQWTEREVGGGNGAYSCVGANVRGTIGGLGKTFFGNYDLDRKILTWDTIEYKKVK